MLEASQVETGNYEHPFLVRKRLMKTIRASPRDRAAREELAALYRSVGLVRSAEEQERKARQCERFDPDFNYRSRFEKYDLKVETFVDGELVRITDGPYEFWAEPGALQDYLTSVPEDEWNAINMPLDDPLPSPMVLERLADDSQVPGRYFKSPYYMEDQSVLKQLPGGSWLLLYPKETPQFIDPVQADLAGYFIETLVPHAGK